MMLARPFCLAFRISCVLRLPAGRAPPSARRLHASQMLFMDQPDADAIFEPRPSGGPSDKQLRYARSLAEQQKKELHPDAKNDWSICSSEIERLLSTAPPTAKQIRFAEELAEAKNMQLPREVLASQLAMRRFLDENSGGSPRIGSSISGTSAPTEKQVLFAAQLARQLRIDIPYQAVESAIECSAFISDALAKKNEQSAALRASSALEMDKMHDAIDTGRASDGKFPTFDTQGAYESIADTTAEENANESTLDTTADDEANENSPDTGTMDHSTKYVSDATPIKGDIPF
ncbi:hypothetical protein AB1Y20_006439 [Prymnesium parvum]|uniref:Uncharacterized protein n=1 Tax=Prymnesium parvum TaxID=97485 RepID=A0AB34IY52_PRYPA